MDDLSHWVAHQGGKRPISHLRFLRICAMGCRNGRPSSAGRFYHHPGKTVIWKSSTPLVIPDFLARLRKHFPSEKPGKGLSSVVDYDRSDR